MNKENLNSKQAQPESVWSFDGDKVRSQAQDSAESKKTGIDWSALVESATLYILYALVEDYLKKRREKVKLDSVSPHSAEVETATHENVHFSDDSAGATEIVETYIDTLRDQALNSDATLDHFFSRPIKIHEQEWGVGSPLYFKIDPWSLYFQNARVINRISNYKLMRAKLKVKVILNGNAFHYGRVIVSYNPLRQQDELTVDRAFIDSDVVAASQRPHIWLNPTTSTGGEMELPFFFYKNLMDIVGQDWNQMGELVAHSLQPLKHANGATDDVTVSVFAWAEDVHFSIPTQVEPGAIAPQSKEMNDEYGKKPVSRIAGAIAKAAGYFTEIPYIAPFATATQIGASAVGSIATLFGYSSPVALEHCLTRPTGKTTMSITNMENDSYKLSVDAKQELSVDPRVTGLSSEDQMTIKYVASRESYLTNFPWNVGTAPETLLFQAVVDPSLFDKIGNEHHFTACAFACMPFKYWRGSMQFRFMVVSSGYHKGRLKIVYDPEGGIGSAEYNTAYTTIVDISEETDFSIDVGWGQATTWRRHRGLQGSINYGTAPLGYTSSSTTFGNGTISVYVVNELTVPNSTINNDVEINVLVKMLDDFEVAVPTDDELKLLRVTNSTLTTAPQSFEILPQSSEMTTILPSDVPSKDIMANKTPVNDPSSLVHFGEVIGSFRQVLKRYSLYEYLAPTSLVGPVFLKYDRPHLPLLPGYTTDPVSTGPPSYALVAGDYTFVNMTPLRYVSMAYAGVRGGVRYAIDTSPLLTSDQNTTVLIARSNTFDYAGSEASRIFKNTGTPLGGILNSALRSFNGAIQHPTSVNPMVSAELPYYSEYRFIPAKRKDTSTFMASDPFTTSWYTFIQTNSTGSNDQWLPSYNAAAEDFTCFWYLGPPIFYRESSYPSS